MDAATDVLGRNYAKGKDFAQLFAELKEGSGTRYNPRIVSLIEECQDLYDKLAYITSQGRYKIYREAYREIMEVPSK
jgi:HD-GYP domain-containing protein (c-di-GMP phosphodiesterase class II)